MPPAHADTEIAELGSLVGGVPALHDVVELVGPRVRRLAAEPRRLDHAAALRRGHLLVRLVCDSASSGFNGSSMLLMMMMMMSAPRPVSTPPTAVASRQPCAVVEFALLGAEDRRRKDRRPGR